MRVIEACQYAPALEGDLAFLFEQHGAAEIVGINRHRRMAQRIDFILGDVVVRILDLGESA